MEEEHKDAIWRIIMQDSGVDNVVMKIMQDYEHGVLSTDDTIKSLVIVASSRLKHIGAIQDICGSFIEDEMPPFY